ncbi:hypothetical protein P280DRAFT_405709 [Massarina eburnea CBS 473.64]|uniref:F-box domain-containing protein n=1 Tax=Massarina eburnea CBS 473.64 TaxID=1395130 RepID=A0A6A6RQX2_9PLEO|nr:hypothetical protein P280DRAFT_405709 [Massarina eburnea CBS 473.64]
MPSSTTAFNKLPIELNKAIAHLLPTDCDIARYRHICRATNDAVDGDNLSFWRAVLRRKFALLAGKSNRELKRQYQRRTKYLRRGSGIDFRFGNSTLEKKVLGVLKDLIIESFRGIETGTRTGTGTILVDRPQCLNQLAISKFITDSRLLLNSKRPRANPGESTHINPALAVVKLMCSHVLFDMDAKLVDKTIEFDEAQKAVYASTSLAPIFTGPKKNEVNMEWILHCFNFFRYYMTNQDASFLHESLQDLDRAQRPSAWQGPLKSGSSPLPKYWKGTYAYLERDTLYKFRQMSSNSTSKKASRNENWIPEDLNVDEGKIQSLQLDCNLDGNLPWPKEFEEELHSLRETIIPTTRAQHSKKASTEDEALKNIQVKGWGEDLQDHFYATGWLNPLPDQCEIPGFMRFTLMKHFEDNLDNFTVNNLWAYEGVVLPGSRIILGRWWYASETEDLDKDYSGPFILWAVDPEPDFSDDSDSGA